MRLTGYAGVDFAALNVKAGAPDRQVGPDVFPLADERPDADPSYAGSRRGPFAIPVTFVVKRDANTEQTLLTLLGKLDPRNTAQRTLAGALNDGVGIEIEASVGTWEFTTVNTLVVTFHATDPIWRKVQPETTTATQSRDAAGVTMDLVNTGHATSSLIVTIAGTATGGTASNSKLAFRRTFTVALAASATDPLANQWVRVELGNTTGWVASGKALSDGSNVYVFTADGQEIRRELINFNDTVSYLGIVVTDLAPGITREYVIAYGTALATAPLDFSSTVEGKRNAFVGDTSFERNTVSSATATTIDVSGTPWRTDQWLRGDVQMLTGAAAGESKVITTNDSNTLTIASAFSTTPSAGDAFLITMSRTDKWLYPVAQVERADFKRGLWWISRGQSQPQRFSFDAPGAWHPILTIQNTDDKVQKLWTPVNLAPTPDYVAILDTNYGWDGRFAETGNDREVANGVALSSPLPILSWRLGWQFKNPNGMTKAVFGMRESGATDWEPITTVTTASDTLVNTAASTLTTVPAEGVTKHLAAFLLPFNDTEIPLDWIKDTGTATSGSATQLGDNTKEWQSDQYINGRIRLLSGAGAPQTRTVGDNAPNTITPSTNFSPAPDSTTRYQVTNKQLLATLRSFDMWMVTFDVSDITIAAVSAEADNYDLALTVRLDGGDPAAGPYQRARVGLDGNRVMFGTGQALRIDGTRRTVEMVTAATGALVRIIADPDSVRIEDVDADDAPFRAGDWLALTPGSHDLRFEWDAGNGPLGADITAAWTEGNWG